MKEFTFEAKPSSPGARAAADESASVLVATAKAAAPRVSVTWSKRRASRLANPARGRDPNFARIPNPARAGARIPRQGARKRYTFLLLRDERRLRCSARARASFARVRFVITESRPFGKERRHMFGHIWSRTKRGAEVTGRVLESSVGRSARDAVPAAKSHGPRVDFTSLPSVHPSALFRSLNGDRSVRRCARCRHRGLQNRAVKRRRGNDRWQIAQTIVCFCFSDVGCPK